MKYMKTKTGRMISWILLNFGLLLGLILGTVYELDGVLNVVIFIIWIFALISLFYFSDNIVDRLIGESEYLIESPYPVPKELFWGYDVVLLLTLAYMGHFVLAFIYSISVIGQLSFYKKIEDSKKYD